VFAIDDDHIIVTIGRNVLASTDGARSWKHVHELPDSSSPQGVLPTSFLHTGETTYLAEYAGGDVPGRILMSEDAGETWTTLLERTDVRHFHGVFEDPYTGTLWATTGDRDDESAIGRLENETFVPVGRGSQKWRAVDLEFTKDAVFWGMDCSYAAENKILRLRKADDAPGPIKPEVLGTTENSIFFLETLYLDDETWLVVSTGSETGIDSTAPPEQRRNASNRTVRVLTASQSSAYTKWYEILRFDRRKTLGDSLPALPISNAHAFLGTDP